ncbi:MAG: glutamate synthase subunit alpha, partial [Lentisphaeria bacterium]
MNQKTQFQQIPNDRGLYSFENEHDACGVGMVAQLNNEPSHEIVVNGLTILKRLHHRGATGGDSLTGDGAGLLIGMPDSFFRSVCSVELPEKGKFAVAMLFGGEDAQSQIEAIISDENLKVIAWRTVPTCPEKIGEIARQSCPLIRQIFIDCSNYADSATIERKLFITRRSIEKSITGIYFTSFSSRSIVYKGMLLADQLEEFYPDLSNENFSSTLAVVHQRYSTNTFPTWKLAHPFRFLAHNGEINTLRGNLNQLTSREKFLKSELFGDDLEKVLPLIEKGQSDSASLDNMFELLLNAGRDLRHTMLMLVPQAWGKKYYLGQ